MTSFENPVIPKGSTVLVTGVNGLIGSHIVDQFLAAGYKVRGTVGDTAKNAWLTSTFDKKHGKGAFELVQVPDMMVENALTKVVKGVAAVVHTTSVMSMDSDPNKVIPITIAGALNAIKAAYSEPSVKRFVYTSSSSAAYSHNQTPKSITSATWNEQAVKKAWAQDPGAWGVEAVYPASKTQSEQEIWKYAKENKDKRPDIVVNTVLPNFNMGPAVDPVNQGHASSSFLLVTLFTGTVIPYFKFFDPQYYVDVRDTARLHLAAVIHPGVRSERLFAFAGRFNWDAVLDILRRNYPDKQFPDNFQSGRDANEIEERPRAEQLLRDLGQPGWTSLEEAVLENTRDVAAKPMEELMEELQKVMAARAAVS